MPKVIIELQANTQDAVNKIQQFARAQKDAFDAVKAGNPALQDASVKVSKLSENTSNAAAATGEFNRAAKSLAAGGIRDLTSGIPVVGDAMAGLAGTLKGFPAILLGVVGAGAAYLAWLRDVQTETGKALAATTALADGMDSKLKKSVLELQAIRARRGGDAAGALEFQAGADTEGVTDARRRAVEAAQKKLDATLDPRAFGGAAELGRGMPGGEVVYQSYLALLNKRKAAEAEFFAAQKAAEGTAALDVLKINEQKTSDLKALEDQRLKAETDAREKAVEAAAAAAEKQKKLIEDLTTSALSTLQGLGDGFKDATQGLELTQFVEATTKKIADLNAGIDAGLDTHHRFAEAIQVLQQKMDEAVRLGYVPMKAAAEAATVATENAGAAALQASQAFAAMAQAVAQAGQAMAQGRPGVSQDTSSHTGTFTVGDPSGSPGPMLDRYFDESARYQINKTLDATSMTWKGSSIQSFQHGGTVPGLGPVPIIAHGGERIVPAGGGDGGGRRMVRIEAGAVQISGTVIDQRRDWDGLVAELGQALADRAR